MINSTTNPLIKTISGLKQKKGRLEHGLYLAEGIRLVTEALTVHAPIRQFFWTERLMRLGGGPKLLETLGVDYEGIEVSEPVLAKMCETEHPQGILAVVALPGPQEIVWDKIRLGIIIDGLQDPGNTGTILRTAWAAGLDGVFLTPDAADPYQGKVVRASMGGIFSTPVFPDLTPEIIVRDAGKAGIRITAGVADAGESLYETDLRPPTLFLVGNEGRGIGEKWTELPHQKIFIPQPGRAESLNVATAAGIMIYEALRQRMYGKKT